MHYVLLKHANKKKWEQNTFLGKKLHFNKRIKFKTY